MKEYKVGEIVTIKGTKCRVTKSDGSCDGCAHRNSFYQCDDDKGEHECMWFYRSDHNNVIFKPIPSAHKDVNSALGESIQSEFPLPPENMRVWIRGNKDRGEEVIKTLTDLGAENPFEHGGEFENVIYYINSKKEVGGAIIGVTSASLIANFYTEIKLPWKPKDKELVWAWDNDYPFSRHLSFYDAQHNCTFCSGDGTRTGVEYIHYAPYEGEWPEWAKEALKKLEELL